ncbi:hypothetical protein IFM89_003267 [Coptis chinensis]|uniref:Uncharacterized protein n=1 Tax=Coptis chinensis TaxID=261450 RepID=A0A835I525_9MAGN|nr:hypothetical protein IFM89_003267 [Coptis chinensis]
MAVGLGTGVPWIICKLDDAPDLIIDPFGHSAVQATCFAAREAESWLSHRHTCRSPVNVSKHLVVAAW